MYTRSSHKRIKIRVPIKIIFILGALEMADCKISDRRHGSLDGYLEQVIREDQRREQTPREHAEKSRDGDESGRVDQLADQGAADGASPQPAAPGENLHFGEDGRVAELAHRVGGQTGQHDPAAAHPAEDGVVGGVACVTLPGALARQVADRPERDRGQRQAEESRPNHATGIFVAVHLGQDVAEDVTDGEEDRARVEGHRHAADGKAQVDNFGRRRDVADDQHGHKDRHDGGEIPIRFHGMGTFAI